MIGVVAAFIFILGAIGLMIGGVIMNRMDPNYSSALAVPIFNALSILLTGIGLVISVMTHQRNPEMALAKRTKVFGLVCLIILLALLPFSNTGSLSMVR